MRQSGSLPPGAGIWWEWHAVTSTGEVIRSERQTTIWLDSAHPWTVQTDGMVRLHSYALTSQQSTDLLSTANQALKRLTEQTGISAQQPIDIYIYANTADMKDAILYEAGWVGGLAYSGYNVVLIGISADQMEWGKQTIAHEITHVLTGDFSFSCLGSIPTWLSEGLAMVGEGGPQETALQTFKKSIQEDTLFSFQVLSGGFSENPDKADLSYTQSFSMVDYLLQHAGQQKMNQFLTVLAQGAELDDALNTVYGFDLAGFEAAWREEIGAAALAQAENTLPTPTPTWIPTIQPVSPQAMVSTPAIHPTAILPTPTATKDKSSSKMPVTLLAILMSCCGIAGVIIVTGLTYLIAKDRNKKRNLTLVLAFTTLSTLWIGFNYQIVHSQADSPTPVPMFPTATAYLPSTEKPGVYIDESLGFKLKIPAKVQTVQPGSNEFRSDLPAN